MASIASITPPTRPITETKLLRPAKKRSNGEKQVIAQAKFFVNFKSYQKTFFNVSPKVIKEVKVVKSPKNKAKITIPFPKVILNPPKADSVVFPTVIPKIR